MLSGRSLLPLLLLGVTVSSKPIEDVWLGKNVNEVDTGAELRDYKRFREEVDVTRAGEVPRPFSRLSNDEMTSSARGISTLTSTSASPKTSGPAEIARERLPDLGNGSRADNGSTRQQGFGWLFSPFTQRIQFSPQTLFQEKIGQLKDTISNIGSIFPNQQDEGGSKQFPNVGTLVNLVGLNDSGFYTNRLEPAGFFGGNGWFANKGGILGGPGAFISTGSLFTDYPTPYKK